MNAHCLMDFGKNAPCFAPPCAAPHSVKLKWAAMVSVVASKRTTFESRLSSHLFFKPNRPAGAYFVFLQKRDTGMLVQELPGEGRQAGNEKQRGGCTGSDGGSSSAERGGDESKTEEGHHGDLTRVAFVGGRRDG